MSIIAGTRETAFLNAITSAGIAREIARKCKEQELASCNCDLSVDSSDSADGRNISGCGDNSYFGVFIAKQFTDVILTDDNPISMAELHNNKAGRLVSYTIMHACIHIAGYVYIMGCSYNVNCRYIAIHHNQHFR